MEQDKNMQRFRSDICLMSTKINILLITYDIPHDITTIAALKLLARMMELGNMKMQGRNLRDVTFGEMSDASLEIVEAAKKELDFILADER